MIWFESRLEKIILVLLLLRGDVYDIQEQLAPIRYRDANNKERKHFFDFLVTFADGNRKAIAVKKSKQAVKIDFAGELQLIADQLPCGLIDEVVLMTEQCFTKVQSLNALRFYNVVTHSDADADEIVELLVSNLVGRCTIGDLVHCTNLGGRGFQAVVRAIYRGRLENLSPARLISYDTAITMAATK
jgi:hypothetical protein